MAQKGGKRFLRRKPIRAPGKKVGTGTTTLPAPARPQRLGIPPDALASDHKPRRAAFARPRLKAGEVLLYGVHAVEAALVRKKRAVYALYATEAGLKRLKVLLPDGILLTLCAPDDFAALVPRDAVHQGLVLHAGALPPKGVEDIPEQGLVLILDQVTDPHNVGAIMRTAVAYGVDALIVTARHSPAFSGVLAKAASGALDCLDVLIVPNLAMALRDLRDLGFTCLGLDSEAPHILGAEPVSRPLALVLGAEGEGLRRLTRTHCDWLVRLDVPGAIKSLNVSNACAVSLALIHEVLRKQA